LHHRHLRGHIVNGSLLAEDVTITANADVDTKMAVVWPFCTPTTFPRSGSVR
jgi:hypothetical protein